MFAQTKYFQQNQWGCYSGVRSVFNILLINLNGGFRSQNHDQKIFFIKMFEQTFPNYLALKKKTLADCR